MTSFRDTKVKRIAFYLPQYHPISENDDWWGKGYTEWHNVSKARPLFKGHEQPKLPGELGFYDLRLQETQENQSLLALHYGISAFCYWHYWFGGKKRLLSRPYGQMLTNENVRVQHCLCWANHDWTRSWLGESNKVMMKQKYYGAKDFKNHFYDMLPALSDTRYLRIKKSPLFGIYDPNFPDAQLFMDTWQELASKEGISEITFFTFKRYHSRNFESQINQGFKYYTKLNPSYDWHLMDHSWNFKVKRKLYRWLQYSCTIYDYNTYVEASCNELEKNEIPTVVANWDRTPRVKSNGELFINFSPKLFKTLNEKAQNLVEKRSVEESFYFIKSWNEWAEGNYLEPDQKNGRALLESIIG